MEGSSQEIVSGLVYVLFYVVLYIQPPELRANDGEECYDVGVIQSLTCHGQVGACWAGIVPLRHPGFEGVSRDERRHVQDDTKTIQH